jgi:hypothetical protein
MAMSFWKKNEQGLPYGDVFSKTFENISETLSPLWPETKHQWNQMYCFNPNIIYTCVWENYVTKMFSQMPLKSATPMSNQTKCPALIQLTTRDAQVPEIFYQVAP